MIFTSLLVVLFGNLWIWRILSISPPIAILTIIVAILLLDRVSSRPKKSIVWLTTLFSLLLFFQFKTTDVQNLTYLDNDQQRIQQMRLREYPPVHFSLLGKTVWIPIAHWFEGRQESIAFFRILGNLSETIDPNLYFFANHPRERIGIKEFEKFPYIFLPLFVYGIFLLIEKEERKLIALSFFVPVFMLSFVGNKNPLGPFSLFPFIAVSISVGLKKTYKRLQATPRYFKNILTLGFVTLLLLIIVQMTAYALN